MGVRHKTDDIVEKSKMGKLGMKEQPLIEQMLSPAETTWYRALADNSRLGEGGEVGEVFEKQTHSSSVVQVSGDAVPP